MPYTIRTPRGNIIRKNRVELSPAVLPPGNQPQTAVNPATEDSKINPTPSPDTKMQAQVNQQASQQTHEEQNRTVEATPEQNPRQVPAGHWSRQDLGK